MEVRHENKDSIESKVHLKRIFVFQRQNAHQEKTYRDVLDLSFYYYYNL